MSNRPGSPERPLRVAVVGTGPSGMYAAQALLAEKDLAVTVDLFDRLPTPWGLVRYGVAPDHQKIKNVTRVFERTAKDDRVRFFGNVALGRDLSREDLAGIYDQVVYAVGAQSDRKLGIPGEDLEGSLSSTELVAWYNCHPDYADVSYCLDHRRVAVVGIGNVAMDVTRILAKPVSELATTDISDAALAELEECPVEDIYILARRGPVQAKCSPSELKEVAEIEGAQVLVDERDLEIGEESTAALEEDRSAQKNMELFGELAAAEPVSGARKVRFRFFTSPVEVLGENGEVTGLRVERTRLEPKGEGYLAAVGTGETEVLPVTMVVRAIGYRSHALVDLPYDERRAVIPNREGRIEDPDADEELVGEYVVGWVKRGPTGLIGTNKLDAVETVRHMVEDVEAGRTLEPERSSPQAILELLGSRGIRYVRYEDWERLDRAEVERGKTVGRPRIKFPRVEEMLLELGR